MVGKGFKYDNNILNNPYIKEIFKYIKNPNYVPFFDAINYPANYLNTIIKSSKILAEAQKNKIISDINRSKKGREETYKYIYSIQNEIEEWYIKNYIVPCNKKLNIN